MLLGVRSRLDEEGEHLKLTLRNGQEWNFEYDAMKRLRHVISPNQEVIGFSRDEKGDIISIDYAQYKKNKFYRDSRGNIRKIEFSDGQKREFRHDALGHIIFDSQGNMSVTRDSLGNISTIQQDQKKWRIIRDGYGNISRWNEVSFGRNSAGLIVSITETDNKWKLLRDPVGRITSIERSDKLVSVEYDSLGYPKVWVEGQRSNTVKRNEYGWAIEEGDKKIARDRRGWISEVQYGDMDWEWRRDGSGLLYRLSEKDAFGLRDDEVR